MRESARARRHMGEGTSNDEVDGLYPVIGTNITTIFTHPPEAIEKFNKSDFSYTLGVSYFVNRHWGFTWRYTQSVNYLFDPKDYPSEPNFDRLYALKGYFFTVQTCWLF